MSQHYLYYTLFDLWQIIHKKYSIGLVFILLLITTIVGFNSTLQAQTLPQEITYQGKLVQDGVPFNGSTTMIFELINPTTNVIEWTETQTINVQDGLYSVVLGAQTPFTSNFFAQNPSLGLRVSVNGNALTPITVLRAVPYAHSAGSVANNSINSIQIVNGTIRTIDIASGGQNKILATDANGLVTWVDRTSLTTPTPNLEQVLNTSNDAGNLKVTNLATPTDPNDATTKAYVDAVAGSSLQDLSPSLDGSITISTSSYNGSSAATISVADGGITTDKIANDAVRTDKIADNAVTTGKILDGTIKADDIEPTGAANDEVLISTGSTVVWTPTTSLSITETDPKVGNLLNDTIPRWNGSQLVNGSISDNGTNVSISNATSINNLSVSTLTLGGFDANTITTSSFGVLSPFSDQALVSEQAITDYVASQIASIPSETDPKVGNLLNDTIPRWNGSQLVNGSISDNGTLSTSAPFTFSNPTPIIYTNNGFTNTLIFEPLGDDKTITFPNASGTVLLDGNLAGNFGNGLSILSTDASKVGLGGQLIEPVLISGFDGLLNHNFELVNMGNIGFQANDSIGLSSLEIEFQANNFINIDAGNTIELSATDIELEADEVLITLDTDAVFVIEDAELTPNEILVLDRDADGINEFSIDLQTVNSGSITSAGDISIKAQNLTNDGASFEAANFTLEGGSGESNRGGNATLNGGAGTGNKGAVFLQSDGGNVEIGDGGLDSELLLNGWLNLPNLSILPSLTTNSLYATGGDLFWDDINLSLGSSLWEETNLNNIFSQDSTKVGIGAFTTAFEPLADLHIRRVLTSAELKITTLRNVTGQNSRLILQSATDNVGNADNSNTNDILGEIIFEGHNGSFQEAAKIDVLLTDATLFENEMRFSVDGTEKMNISDDGVEIVNTDFNINNTLDNQANATINLGSVSTGGGGVFDVYGQHSTQANSIGGYINIFAGNNIATLGVGGNVNIYAGDGATTNGIGGNIEISGGFGNTRGLVELQQGGGDVTIGNNSIPNSELQVNGLINMPDYAGTNPSSGNFLYANGTDLFWNGTNLSAGTSPWINDGSNNLYYPTNNGTIGIGDFSSLAPQADLHIKRIGTGIPANIRLTSAQGTSTPSANTTGDIIGDITFEGFNVSFQEAAKIDVVVTNNTASLETDMRFSVGGAEHMRIQNDGIVAIGKIRAGNINSIPATTATFDLQSTLATSTPEAPFFILRDNGSKPVFETFTNGDVRMAGGTTPTQAVVTIGDFDIVNQAASPTYNTVANVGGSLNGFLAPNPIALRTFRLLVGGHAAFNGDVLAGEFTLTSDRRFKKDITSLHQNTSMIQKLRGVNYFWRTEEFEHKNFSDKKQFGLIAQEVYEVFPELVNTSPDGYLSVNYIGLVPVLIEATKEQQTIIDNQKEEINTQKIELENLKKQISELKEIVASLQENQDKENSNSALAGKVEALEKQLIALVESLSNKKETTTETASLKEE